jgi:hypothetical protein
MGIPEMRFLFRGFLLVVGLAMSTQAQAVTFNFEEFDATRTSGCPTAGGTLASLTSTKPVTGAPNGVTELSMTLKVVKVAALNPSTGAHGFVQFDDPSPTGLKLRFDIRQKWATAPAGFGNRTLDSTCDNPNNGNDDDVWVLANFSQPISLFEMESTDAGIYPDKLTILAYEGPNASGDFVKGQPFDFMGANPTFLPASLTAGGALFRSVLFRSDDGYLKRGDFTDNITVTPIPEPSTGMLGGFTIGALAVAAGLLKRS